MWNTTNSTSTEMTNFTYFNYYNYMYNYFSYYRDDEDYNDSNNRHNDKGSYKYWMTRLNFQKLCESQHNVTVGIGLKLFILVTALLANSALLCKLCKSRHNLSPAQLLAFNMSIMNILYCLSVPCVIYKMLGKKSDILLSIIHSLSALKLFGVPLFSTFMCLERYIAAAFPVTYLQLSKKKHRIILSVFAWTSTVAVSIFLSFSYVFATILSLAVITSVFFLIMLWCLAGIIYVLCQSRPGDGASSSNSLRKQTLCNIIMVTVPSAIAYVPLVAVIFYTVVILSIDYTPYTKEQCTTARFLLAFPNFGVYIGPLFYISMIRQITCCKTRMPPMVEHMVERTVPNDKAQIPSPRWYPRPQQCSARPQSVERKCKVNRRWTF